MRWRFWKLKFYPFYQSPWEDKYATAARSMVVGQPQELCMWNLPKSNVIIVANIMGIHYKEEVPNDVEFSLNERKARIRHRMLFRKYTATHYHVTRSAATHRDQQLNEPYVNTRHIYTYKIHPFLHS